MECKKLAKENRMAAAKILAKEVVNTRRAVERMQVRYHHCDLSYCHGKRGELSLRDDYKMLKYKMLDKYFLCSSISSRHHHKRIINLMNSIVTISSHTA